MKEIPILFSTPMVRAIQCGNKTQTRRVLKHQPSEDMGKFLKQLNPCQRGKYSYMGDIEKGHEVNITPYAFKNDLLWVREKWLNSVNDIILGYCMYAADMPIHWDAKDTEHDEDVDLIESDYKWKSSIHMYKKDSRLWLKVTDIRIEKLGDISEEDAKAEGIEPNRSENGEVIEGEFFKYPYEKYCDDFPAFSAVESFESLWDSINGKPRKDGKDISWKANPWVWAVEFEIFDKNNIESI